MPIKNDQGREINDWSLCLAGMIWHPVFHISKQARYVRFAPFVNFTPNLFQLYDRKNLGLSGTFNTSCCCGSLVIKTGWTDASRLHELIRKVGFVLGIKPCGKCLGEEMLRKLKSVSCRLQYVSCWSKFSHRLETTRAQQDVPEYFFLSLPVELHNSDSTILL